MSDLFDESYYLLQKAEELNSQAYRGKTDWNVFTTRQAFSEFGLTPRQHYERYGAFEDGVNPALYFDDESYYASKASQMNSSAYNGRTNWTAGEVSSLFSSLSLNALDHYQQYGYGEGLTAEWSASLAEKIGVTISDYAILASLDNVDADLVFVDSKVLKYSFMTSPHLNNADTTAFAVMDQTQKQGVAIALSEVSKATGISFVETSSQDETDISFGLSNLDYYSGMCYYTSSPVGNDGSLFDAKLYIYMDNDTYHSFHPDDGSTYENGYNILLHEIGHAMGLKHPFEGTQLLGSYDSTSYTLMSYNHAQNVDSGLKAFDTLALQYVAYNDALLLGFNV